MSKDKKILDKYPDAISAKSRDRLLIREFITKEEVMVVITDWLNEEGNKLFCINQAEKDGGKKWLKQNVKVEIIRKALEKIET